MRLNTKKTHGMTISFTKAPPIFELIVIDATSIESVDSAKLVGVEIQIDLKWDKTAKKSCESPEKAFLYEKFKICRG